MTEENVKHPTHTIPEEYKIDGFVMGECMAQQETLKLLKTGEGPQYEVLVATYPRSGTAKILEVAWLLMNDIDVQRAKEVPQTSRCIFLDLCDPTFKTCFGGTIKLGDKKYPLAKTHLPYHMLKTHVQRDTKIIVGLRNPKDTLVSIYHFYTMCKSLGNYKGSFADFFPLVKDKHLAYGDVFDFHVGWWNVRNRKNILYVFYEDMEEDSAKEVRRISEFLGKKYSDEDVLKVVEWTSFGNMREERSTNYEALSHRLDFKISPYMRKGQVGDWKTTMNKEQSNYMDEQYHQTCVPLGLKFRFE